MATILELFAGAGGAALGLRAAGLWSVGLVEYNPDACATLRAAGLGPVLEGDVRRLDVAPRADVWWASPPCQPFSSANKHRAGHADDRNGWPWVCELYDRTPEEDRPTWLIAENVPGMVRGKCKPWFNDVLLPMLRARFAHVQWAILRASDYGVPQHRDRVIIIAGPHPVPWPTATHGEPGQLHLQPWVTTGEALGLTPPDRVVGGGHNPSRAGDVRRYGDLTDRPSTTVAASRSGNAGPWVVHSYDRNGEITDEPAGTILGCRGGRHSLRRPDEVGDRRQLTVQECAILQGFPPDHPFHGNKTSRYQQVGNAVPPRLAEVIGRAILDNIRSES